MTEDTAPKQNDVYRWHWKEGCKPIIGCYAHLGVFIDECLIDTYWSDWRTARSSVELDRVDLTLLGNIDDCREIKLWDLPYYDPADIIDMRHANDSRAPIYLKLTAAKSQEWMLARAEKKYADAIYDKERAEQDIAEWSKTVAKIKAGDLEVYL